MVSSINSNIEGLNRLSIMHSRVRSVLSTCTCILYVSLHFRLYSDYIYFPASFRKSPEDFHERSNRTIHHYNDCFSLCSIRHCLNFKRTNMVRKVRSFKTLFCICNEHVNLVDGHNWRLKIFHIQSDMLMNIHLYSILYFVQSDYRIFQNVGRFNFIIWQVGQ